jgi:hypothetical protein
MGGIAVPKPCPWCGERGGLTIDACLVARPLGAFSLAGAQMKFSAYERAELACSLCGGSRLGFIDGRDFVAERLPPVSS